GCSRSAAHHRGAAPWRICPADHLERRPSDRALPLRGAAPLERLGATSLIPTSGQGSTRGDGAPDSSAVPGETDLSKMLASLRIERRQDPVTVVHLVEPVALGAGVMAVIGEDDGTTAVVTVAEAERPGWPVDFRGA